MSEFPHKANSIWCRLKNAKPGERFQKLYDARRENPNLSMGGQRWLNLSLGVGSLVAGVIMLAIPGPGILVLLLGLALLATESRWMAEVLDRAEVAIRGWWRERKPSGQT